MESLQQGRELDMRLTNTRQRELEQEEERARALSRRRRKALAGAACVAAALLLLPDAREYLSQAPQASWLFAAAGLYLLWPRET